MNSQASYANRMTDALKGHVANPPRLLVLAVVARWAEDCRSGYHPEPDEGDDIDPWLEAAEIPREWLRFQNDAAGAYIRRA